MGLSVQLESSYSRSGLKIPFHGVPSYELMLGLVGNGLGIMIRLSVNHDT